MFYEAKDHHGLKHDPLKCLIAPRPIGWISTLDSEGHANLAPFSFFNGVSADPPVVMFSAGGQHHDGGFKDSAANAEATGEFVCNLTTWSTREQMNLTSAEAPRGWDEFKLAGLTPTASSSALASVERSLTFHGARSRYSRRVSTGSRSLGVNRGTTMAHVIPLASFCWR